jgi:hypothetical protein
MTFPPNGLDELKAMFSDATLYHDRKEVWEQLVLEYAPVPPGLLEYIGKPVARIRAHRVALGYFLAVLNRLHADGFRGLEYGGIYNYRPKRSNWKVLSVHAWGIAIDLEPSRNPQGYAPRIDPRIVAAFEAEGFEWGGRWSRPDGMHFQLASGY